MCYHPKWSALYYVKQKVTGKEPPLLVPCICSEVFLFSRKRKKKKRNMKGALSIVQLAPMPCCQKDIYLHLHEYVCIFHSIRHNRSLYRTNVHNIIYPNHANVDHNFLSEEWYLLFEKWRRYQKCEYVHM